VPDEEPTRTGPAEQPDAASPENGQAEAAQAGVAAQTGGLPEAGGAPEPQAVNNEVEQLRLDLEAVSDRALRAQAELENYRRRVARDREDERRYADLPLLRDLLPVLDNMRRAIEAAEKTEDAPSLLEGFRLVTRQLEDVLERHHCTEIEALGRPFDPHLHEAISQQPSAEHPPGTVLLVAQPGFRLHDRVVRPSQVIVSGGAAEQEGET
jgi:molecular chaperone GrpE